MQNNVQNTLNYLNKHGAHIKIIKLNDNYPIDDKNKEKKIKNIIGCETTEENLQNDNSFFQVNNSFKSQKFDDNKIQFIKNKKTEKSKKSNINIKKITNDIHNNIENNNIEENFKKRIKSSNGSESDITKYVKGEITADEIGLSAYHRKKILRTLKNQFEEHLIDKTEYQKSGLTNRAFSDNKKDNNLINNKNDLNDELFNDDLYLNHANSFENGKVLKTEKRIIKSLSGYRNIMKIDFKDLDAKFHSNDLSLNYNFKSSRNNNNNYFSKINKEKNKIHNKNTSCGINFTKINNSKNSKDIKNKIILKNLNLNTNNKILISNNINKELSAIKFFNKDKNNSNTNKLLSPIEKKINKNKINFKNNKNVIKVNNKAHSPSNLRLTKVTEKFLNFNLKSSNSKRLEPNSDLIFNSDGEEKNK